MLLQRDLRTALMWTLLLHIALHKVSCSIVSECNNNAMFPYCSASIRAVIVALSSNYARFGVSQAATRSLLLLLLLLLQYLSFARRCNWGQFASGDSSQSAAPDAIAV